MTTSRKVSDWKINIAQILAPFLWALMIHTIYSQSVYFYKTTVHDFNSSTNFVSIETRLKWNLVQDHEFLTFETTFATFCTLLSRTCLPQKPGFWHILSLVGFRSHNKKLANISQKKKYMPFAQKENSSYSE